MTHTKGTLRIDGPSLGRGRLDDGGDYAIRDETGKIVGEAVYQVDYGTFRPARENAQLWATSPKLLGACELLVDELEHVLDTQGVELGEYEQFSYLRSVISEARGRS